MTCAHVVDAALKKVAGVESVEVSLNKGLATVKLKAGNTVSIPQLWELIHKNGYTPKETAVSVRGAVTNVQGRVALQISGTKDIIPLGADPMNPTAYDDLAKKSGETVVIRGVMTPAKDFKSPVPLQVGEVH